jgi:hypothetical protein
VRPTTGVATVSRYNPSRDAYAGFAIASLVSAPQPRRPRGRRPGCDLPKIERSIFGGIRDGTTVKGTLVRAPRNGERPALARLLLRAELSFNEAAGTLTLAAPNASYTGPACEWPNGDQTVAEPWKT